MREAIHYRMVWAHSPCDGDHKVYWLITDVKERVTCSECLKFLARFK